MVAAQAIGGGSDTGTQGTAAMNWELRGRRRQKQSLGDAGLRWEGKECEVAFWTPPPRLI